MIDVASLGSHSLEQHEGRDRSSYYVNKMKSLTSTKLLSKPPKQSMLLDVPNPEKAFASDVAVSTDDLRFVSSTFFSFRLVGFRELILDHITIAQKFH